MSSPLYRLRQARSALGAAIETLERSRAELETVIQDLEDAQLGAKQTPAGNDQPTGPVSEDSESPNK
jgi:prefoldin subunit 5